MISLEHNFLFVHIPKTGGNSVQSILSKYSEDQIVAKTKFQDGVERFAVQSQYAGLSKHSTLRQYRKCIQNESIFENLFKFTIVRNPWDRMISFYFSPHRNVEEWNREKFIELVAREKRLEDFISYKRKMPWESGANFMRKAFSTVDFVIRFESLQEDFSVVLDKLGISSEILPVRNSSKRSSVQEYYDEDLVKLVEKRFKNEIDYFGYSFNG